VSAKQASAATAPKELSAEAPVFKLKQVASQQPSEAAEKYIDQEKEQLREKLRYSETIIMTLQTELEETRSMLAWKELELEHKKAIEMLEHVVSRALPLGSRRLGPSALTLRFLSEERPRAGRWRAVAQNRTRQSGLARAEMQLSCGARRARRADARAGWRRRRAPLADTKSSG